MARKRMIDPGIWDSEQVMKLSPLGFKLYIYLISQADDEGREKLCYPMMTSRVFPFGGCDETAVRAVLKDMGMGNMKLVQLYEVNGSEYLVHPNWKTYQKIDRPTLSRLPPPPPLDESSTSPRESFVTNGIEEKGIEEKVSGKPYAVLVREVIEYLNAKTGRSFSVKNRNTAVHISAREREGWELEDFKAVIDAKVKEWGPDPKMSAYLRPETLFGTKFDSYLAVAKSGMKMVVSDGYPTCPKCGKPTTGRRSGEGGGRYLYTCPCGGSVVA